MTGLAIVSVYIDVVVRTCSHQL